MSPKRNVTLEDIADKVGVSVATVSQTLSGKGRISDATRERIRQVVEELAYQPDQYAQNLAKRSATQAGGRRLKRAKGKHIPPPGLMIFYSADEIAEVVQLEIQQRDEEGYDVSGFSTMLTSLSRPSKQKFYRVYSDILSTLARSDFTYGEPETLPDICDARPDGPRHIQLAITSTDLLERIEGAWLGRVAGSVLGKPLQRAWSKNKVIQYLQLSNSYPLTNYIPRLLSPPPAYELGPEAMGHFLGEIKGAPFDDDTDYSILALHNLETYGLDYQTADVATEWLSHLSYFNTYTTERAVYRNLVWNVHPDEAACFVNPEREFAGARTRADVYGYVAPGKPELAAQLAYQDAALSHTKNGIYSAMLIAAMIAWTFVTDDIEAIVRVGLSEIPRECRLAEAVNDVLNVYHQNDDWELAYEHLLLKYGAYSPIHTINNTIWVILALLYSHGDFSQALSLAVTCGLDTGSNAATVGSVMGALYTCNRIPSQWTAPLNDTLNTALAQFPATQISELSRRTAQLAEDTLSG